MLSVAFNNGSEPMRCRASIGRPADDFSPIEKAMLQALVT